MHQLVGELEQLIAADLSYPSIAAPIAAGIIDASAYLALDFVAADSLDVVIRNSGPTRPAEALRIIGQLAAALDFAADAQINHGALHPRDVLISADDVRVTGIGIARALERAGHPLAARRPYSAPERIAGGPWDRAADVFSVGALAFELLTGRRIAGVGEQAAQAIGDLPDIDRAALTQILARALAESPGDRPTRAGDVADALHDVLSAAAVTPRVARRRKRPADDAPMRDNPAPLSLGFEESPAHAPVDALAAFSDSAPVDVVPPAPARAPAPTNVPAPRSEPRIESADLDDIALRHPAVPEHDEPIRFVEAPASRPTDSERHDEYEAAPPMSALERSRSAIWPLALALIVGIAVGFGVALATLGRNHVSADLDQPDPTATAAVTPRPPTEVGEPPLRPPDETNVSPATAAAALPPAVTEPVPAAPTTVTSPTAPVPAPATAPARAATPPRVSTGRILVRSTPAGARVFLDGASRGVTPATLADVARGGHTLRLTQDGYRAVERRVTITESRPTQTLQIELAPVRPPAAAAAAASAARRPAPAAAPANTPGSLLVDSRPTGARVLVDGRAVGRTPLTMRSLPVGEYRVQMELEGFRPWSATVKVAAGEQSKVAGSLER